MATAMTRSTPGSNRLLGPGEQQLQQWHKLVAKLLLDGRLSERIKTPEQGVLLMAKAYELGIPPIEGLSKLYVVRGVVAAESQLMMGLAMKSGVVRVEWHEQSPDRCKAIFYRYSPSGILLQSYPCEWTWERVQQAGFHKDARGNVKPTYANPSTRQVMLKHKVEAEGLRTVAPDIIGGVYSPEEFGVQSLSDLTPEVIDAAHGAHLPIGQDGAALLRERGMDCLKAGASKEEVDAIFRQQKADAGVEYLHELTSEQAEVVHRALGQLVEKYAPPSAEEQAGQSVLDGEFEVTSEASDEQEDIFGGDVDAAPLPVGGNGNE